MIFLKIFSIITVTHCAFSHQNADPVNVPKDYVITKGIGAHKYHDDKKTWNQARHSCVQEGAQLAIINSKEEQDLIKKTADKEIAREMWLGYHELFGDDDWTTVTGIPLKKLGYVQWLANQPDKELENEHCMSFAKGGLNDLNCKKATPYICEIDITR